MALGTLVAQTTLEALSPPMRETFVAPTMLPFYCVCRLIRDETESSPDRERSVTPRTYRTTYGVNPAELALTNTSCPTYFTKVLGRVRQYSGSAAASRQYPKRNTVQRREP
jgi:hypothetical protein